MDAYLEALLSYEAAVPVWALMLAWVSIFIATHFVVRAARTAFARQQRIAAPNDPRLSLASQPKYLAAQVLFAAVIFAICLVLASSFFTDFFKEFHC